MPFIYASTTAASSLQVLVPWLQHQRKTEKPKEWKELKIQVNIGLNSRQNRKTIA